MIKPPNIGNESEIVIWRERVSRLLNLFEEELFPPPTPPPTPPPVSEDD